MVFFWLRECVMPTPVAPNPNITIPVSWLPRRCCISGDGQLLKQRRGLVRSLCVMACHSPCSEYLLTQDLMFCHIMYKYDSQHSHNKMAERLAPVDCPSTASWVLVILFQLVSPCDVLQEVRGTPIGTMAGQHLYTYSQELGGESIARLLLGVTRHWCFLSWL